MSARSAATAAVAGVVAAVRPVLLDESGAASFLGYSRSWLRQTRAADAKAMSQGLAPAGPPHVVLLGRTVRYRVADLEAWLDANTVTRGKIPQRGEHPARGGGAQ